jgi:hypothetical protein
MFGDKIKNFHSLAGVIQLAQVHSCREQQRGYISNQIFAVDYGIVRRECGKSSGGDSHAQLPLAQRRVGIGLLAYSFLQP